MATKSLVLVALFGASLGCGSDLGDETGLGLASVRLPTGWVVGPGGGGLVARPGPDAVERIDVSAAPRRDYGVDRTAEFAGDAVITQVRLQGHGVPSKKLTRLGDRPAVLLEWSYVHKGALLKRRHWAIELPDAIAHVSCVGSEPPGLCDSVAGTVKPKEVN